MKTRISKQISRQNQIENDKFNDTYDDIDFAGGKQLYDNYEPIGEESEARYTHSYYTGNNYVEIPATAQTSDNYWRLPVVEPAYLEMTCSSNSSPNVGRKPPPTIQVDYTYEL